MKNAATLLRQFRCARALLRRNLNTVCQKNKRNPPVIYTNWPMTSP